MSEKAVHDAIYDALVSNGALDALLARNYYESPSIAAVYDHVPQVGEAEAEENFPYVVVGESTAVQFDTDDINGMEHTVTIHVWDHSHGRDRIRQILGAIYDVLQNQSLSASGQNVVLCLFEMSEVFSEPDELTEHGVARYRIVTQEG